MPLFEWVDDGSDFGNACGLDRVASDVYRTIAERFGATVHVGRLPADLEAAQGEAPPEDSKRTPGVLASLTISWDGGKVSGDYPDGKSYISGYWTSYWLDRIDAKTLVFDLRTIPDDRATRFAVRGPIHDPSLPPGMVSGLGPIPEMLKPVANAYLGTVGATLADTGYDEPPAAA